MLGRGAQAERLEKEMREARVKAQKEWQEKQKMEEIAKLKAQTASANDKDNDIFCGLQEFSFL